MTYQLHQRVARASDPRNPGTVVAVNRHGVVRVRWDTDKCEYSYQPSHLTPYVDALPLPEQAEFRVPDIGAQVFSKAVLKRGIFHGANFAAGEQARAWVRFEGATHAIAVPLHTLETTTKKEPAMAKKPNKPTPQPDQAPVAGFSLNQEVWMVDVPGTGTIKNLQSATRTALVEWQSGACGTYPLADLRPVSQNVPAVGIELTPGNAGKQETLLLIQYPGTGKSDLYHLPDVEITETPGQADPTTTKYTAKHIPGGVHESFGVEECLARAAEWAEIAHRISNKKAARAAENEADAKALCRVYAEQNDGGTGLDAIVDTMFDSPEKRTAWLAVAAAARKHYARKDAAL